MDEDFRKVEKFCLTCNSKLILKCNSDLKRKYCSLSCSSRAKKSKKYIVDEVSGEKVKIGQYSRRCIKCGRRKAKNRKLQCHDCGMIDIAKSRSNKKKLNCDYCSKEIFRSSHQYNNPKCKHQFCSKNCKNLFVTKTKRPRTLFKRALRNSRQNKSWVKKVLEKHDSRCCKCGSNDYPSVHHKTAFSKIVNEFLDLNPTLDLRNNKNELLKLALEYSPFFDLENGECLCFECHQAEHPNFKLIKCEKGYRNKEVAIV